MFPPTCTSAKCKSTRAGNFDVRMTKEFQQHSLLQYQKRRSWADYKFVAAAQHDAAIYPWLHCSGCSDEMIITADCWLSPCHSYQASISSLKSLSSPLAGFFCFCTAGTEPLPLRMPNLAFASSGTLPGCCCLSTACSSSSLLLAALGLRDMLWAPLPDCWLALSGSTSRSAAMLLLLLQGEALRCQANDDAEQQHSDACGVQSPLPLAVCIRMLDAEGRGYWHPEAVLLCVQHTAKAGSKVRYIQTRSRKVSTTDLRMECDLISCVPVLLCCTAGSSSSLDEEKSASSMEAWLRCSFSR